MALYIGNQKVAPTIEKELVGIPLQIGDVHNLQKLVYGNFTYKFPKGVTQISQYAFMNAFYYATALYGIDFSGIQVIGHYAFSGAFRSCIHLTNITFLNLETIATYALNQAFRDCTSLTTISFPALTSTSFGTYTDQFTQMLVGVTGCTVHFPSNLQSVIGSWSSVTSGFGGTNTTVLFDLPATT